MDVFWKRASLRLIGCIWRFSVCRISVVSRILGISWRGVPCLYCLSICEQWFVPCIGRWRVPVIFYTNVQPTDDPRRLQSSWRIGHSFDTCDTYVLPLRSQAARKIENGWYGGRQERARWEHKCLSLRQTVSILCWHSWWYIQWPFSWTLPSHSHPESRKSFEWKNHFNVVPINGHGHERVQDCE